MGGRTNESIMVNGKVLDEVDHFTYLGSNVSTSGDGEEEIQVRISKASQAFASFRGTWRSKNICQKTKIQFFKSNVLSQVLHSSTRIACVVEIMSKVSDYTRTWFEVLDKQGLTPVAKLRSLTNEGLSASLASVARSFEKLRITGFVA